MTQFFGKCDDCGKEITSGLTKNSWISQVREHKKQCPQKTPKKVKRFLPKSLQNHQNGSMWHWFGLSYSSYLVIPRVLLCGMPHEWQHKFAILLDECREYYSDTDVEDNYSVQLRGDDGKFKKDPYADYRHPKINRSSND